MLSRDKVGSGGRLEVGCTFAKERKKSRPCTRKLGHKFFAPKYFTRPRPVSKVFVSRLPSKGFPHFISKAKGKFTQGLLHVGMIAKVMDGFVEEFEVMVVAVNSNSRIVSG